jgi:hypothetical protein
VARGLEQMEAALKEVEELGKLSCRICWMFKGADAAGHPWGQCDELDERLSFMGCMTFQGSIDYQRDPQARFLSCFYCHVSQELCVDGFQSKGTSCRWKHIVLLVALAASTDKGLKGSPILIGGRIIIIR